MNRGLSCRISEDYRLCGNWDTKQKKGEERSPLNASDPQCEAMTKRGSLCAAFVSLNHEKFPIVWEKVGSGALCSASSDRDGDATELSETQECHHKRATAAHEMERWRDYLLHGQGLRGGQSAWLIGGCIV